MSRTALYKLGALGLLIAIGAPGCGDDSGDDGGKPGATAAAAPAAAAAAAAAGGLVPMQHVEDRVTPKERANIRHVFHEHDFMSPQNNDKNRDPFQSFVVIPIGLAPDAAKIIETTPQCSEKQMVATQYSYSELRLVGVVTEGARRKVLMMDSGNLGHIIQRSDCVGKEKAFVSDIGDGYVTFQVSGDNSPGNRIEEHSVKLHNKVLSTTEPPSEDQGSTRIAPIAPPTPTRGTSVPLPPLPPHGIAPPAIAAPGNAPQIVPQIAPPPPGPPAPTTPQAQQRDDEQPGAVRTH